MIETQTISRRLFLTVNTILLVLLAFTCLYPIWYTFCLSFSDKAATNAGWVTLYPIGFTTSAYGEIIKDTAFFNSFKISLERVFIGTPLTLIIVIMIAYPLSRSQREFHGRNVTMWIVVFCMLFNGGTIPWYMCMKNYGMMDNMAGLILSGSLPVYNVILMKWMAQENGGLFSKLLFPAPNPLSLQLPCSSVFTIGMNTFRGLCFPIQNHIIHCKPTSARLLSVSRWE